VCCGVGMPREFEGLTSARGEADGAGNCRNRTAVRKDGINRPVTVDSSIENSQTRFPMQLEG
jgi:hypothetical protein